MKICITENFRYDFFKIFKYERIFDEFISVLQKKSHTFIPLQFPYKKFKFSIIGVAVRGILFVGIQETLIPIYIAKKNDKTFGENVRLDTSFLKILAYILQQVKNDLHQKQYEMYET